MTAEAAFRRAVAVVARAHRVPVTEVLSPRGLPARRRRQLAAYLAVVGLNQSIKPVARAAGLESKTIRHALARLEDLRDLPEIDERLALLEARL